jgi:calcineurin-like phosphoesterase family protein
MAVWFTADLHLGHANIIKYCNRPFMTPEERQESNQLHISDETVERHDAALIDAINALVGEEDELWILGDFCLRGYAPANLYRKRIRCQRVHLVWGNHDKKSIKKCFSRVLECGMIEVEDQPIWLHHYPQDHWQGQDTGSWHLFGHVHGKSDAADAKRGWRRKDVGVDASRYVPWSFRDLQSYMCART